MIDLSERSAKKEILDGDNIPFEDIKQNMKELNTINTLLGGHKITIAGVAELLPEKTEPFIICEIGCGGGDNMNAINKWCAEKNVQVKFIGIDIKRECIEFAKSQYALLPAQWIPQDFTKVHFDVKPDIIYTSLFCHHFKTEELVSMIQWLYNNTKRGFFINDLQRHPIAYYAIKFLTGIFSTSYLVKNDAPLSVARGFTKKEWMSIFTSAGIDNYKISWKWAFRYLITYKHEHAL